MTRTAIALRRIIKGLGTNRQAHWLLTTPTLHHIPKRCLQTESHSPDTSPFLPPQPRPSKALRTQESLTEPISKDSVVDALLLSIRTHLERGLEDALPKKSESERSKDHAVRFLLVDESPKSSVAYKEGAALEELDTSTTNREGAALEELNTSTQTQFWSETSLLDENASVSSDITQSIWSETDLAATGYQGVNVREQSEALGNGADAGEGELGAIEEEQSAAPSMKRAETVVVSGGSASESDAARSLLEERTALEWPHVTESRHTTTSKLTIDSERFKLQPPSPTDPVAITLEEYRRLQLRGEDEKALSFSHHKLQAKWLSKLLDRRIKSQRVAADRSRRQLDIGTGTIHERWIEAYDLLKRITSKDSASHRVVTQKFPLPQGSALEWFMYPGEVMSTIRRATGCCMQIPILPAQEIRYFTLRGYPDEIDAACQYIVSQRLFGIVQDGVNMSMHNFFRSPPLRIHNAPEKQHGLDEVPMRSTFARRRTRIETTQIIDAALKNIVLPPLQLQAAVEHLTSPMPRYEYKLLATRYGQKSGTTVLCQALMKLLTNPANVPNTMSHTLSTAWVFLIKGYHGPFVHLIERAHAEHTSESPTKSTRAINTHAVNARLLVDASTGNLHSMRASLIYLRIHELRPDIRTWLHFLTITQKLQPDQINRVVAKMKTLGLLEEASHRGMIAPLMIGPLLEADLIPFVESASNVPDTFIPEFVERSCEQLGIGNWTERLIVTKVVDVLLKHNYWDAAFQVCDRALASKLPPTLRTLQAFLFAAEERILEDPDLAARTMHAFGPLLEKDYPMQGHSERTPKPQLGEAQQTVLRSSRYHLTPAGQTYRTLFEIALNTFSWNVLKVVWQHACCAGFTDHYMRATMKQSLLYRHLMTHQDLSSLDEIGFWKASFACFALGVGETSHPSLTNQCATVADEAARGWAQLQQDLLAYGRVQPLGSLSNDIVVARDLDHRWIGRTRKKTIPWGQRKAIWPFRNNIQNPAKYSMTVPVVALHSGSAIDEKTR